ncbi:hypothetical protein [Rhodohalobacter sp.]|uniref:hypothetical protein n=1 Tax=Rhodohalobacter sp. TaxID=1974210 RepID=UPI002ACE2A00|nr:hypothetical protein [Rhodohalobacter sp.]MDZ7756375.1 hypothetical protein [Rhodohalobacter sp.]
MRLICSTRVVELWITSWCPYRTNKFNWNSTLNWWTNTAEITDLKVPSFTTGGFGAALGTFYIAEGFSPTTIVGNAF